MSQQLAHHTITGCTMNAGDMIASGNSHIQKRKKSIKNYWADPINLI